MIDLLFTVVFFAVMFWCAPILAWIVVGSLPFYVVLSLAATPVLKTLTEEKFKRDAENQALLVEVINGVETCKALAVEPQMQRKWDEQLAAYVQVSFKSSNFNSLASLGVQTIQKLATAATLCFGARLVMDGELTIGQLVAFNMLAGRVAQPILRLAQLWQDFQQVRISVNRLGDILNAHPEASTGGGKAALPTIVGTVEFKDAVFRYRPDRPPVLKGINLTIEAGQAVGIVGPSGSGKSTLTRLIQRLYLPESGRVQIDGFDLSSVDPAWLRRQIGVVLQENWLFNRSIKDNIALADPSIPLDRVIHAARMAGAHEFISELAEGYDTVLGEHGRGAGGMMEPPDHGTRIDTDAALTCRSRMDADKKSPSVLIRAAAQRLSTTDEKTKESVFPIRVADEQTAITVEGGKRIPLSPDMAVTAEVRTGTRRPIEYVLAPLQRYKDESGRER